MSRHFLDDTSRYKVPRILYLVRWMNSDHHIMKKCYLRKSQAIDYWEKRKKYTTSPCWIESFELTLTRDNFYGRKIPETYSEAIQ